MAATPVQTVVHTLLNSIIILHFTYDVTILRYYNVPYLPSPNIIFYTQRLPHLRKLIFKTITAAIYSTAGTTVDTRVYFTSVTTVTAVQSGINIFIDTISI